MWVLCELAASDKPICCSCRHEDPSVKTSVCRCEADRNQCQAGRSRWCSCRWKGVCGSCCPRRTPWRWTGPGARRRRSSSPTSWPLAGRSGRSLPPCSGAYNNIQTLEAAFNIYQIGWMQHSGLSFDFCPNIFITRATNNEYFPLKNFFDTEKWILFLPTVWNRKVFCLLLHNACKPTYSNLRSWNQWILDVFA